MHRVQTTCEVTKRREFRLGLILNGEPRALIVQSIWVVFQSCIMDRFCRDKLVKVRVKSLGGG